MERNYPKIQITDKAARSLRSGHPWVYADEVLQADAACVDGQIVDVTTRSGHWLGAATRMIALTRHSGRGAFGTRSITDARSWGRISTTAA